MQGTQYAPRESILCMEHFVALQRIAVRSRCQIRQKPCSNHGIHALFEHGSELVNT